MIRPLMNLINLVLYSALFIILVVSTPDFLALSQEGRYFKIVEIEDRSKGLDNNMLGLVEIDHFGRAITGDTLDTWFQHYDKYGKLNSRAYEADLSVFCFPDYMNLYDRQEINHVLEDKTGLVYAVSLFNWIGIYSRNSEERSLSFRAERLIKDPLDTLFGEREIFR